MSDRIFEWEDERTHVARVSNGPAAGQLGPCPDCGRSCSRQAESCPGCGRYFQQYGRVIEVVPGSGWVAKVAWGIVLSSFLWGAILAVLFVLAVILLIVLFGAGAALVPPQR